MNFWQFFFVRLIFTTTTTTTYSVLFFIIVNFAPCCFPSHGLFPQNVGELFGGKVSVPAELELFQSIVNKLVLFLEWEEEEKKKKRKKKRKS